MALSSATEVGWSILRDSIEGGRADVGGLEGVCSGPRAEGKLKLEATSDSGMSRPTDKIRRRRVALAGEPRKVQGCPSIVAALNFFSTCQQSHRLSFDKILRFIGA